MAQIFGRAQVHRVEAWIRDGSVIVAFHMAVIRRNRVNPNREQVVGIALKKRQRLRGNLADLGQKVCVANMSKAVDLLRAAESRQVILLFRINPRNIVTNTFREWRVGQEFGPRLLSHPGHKAISAEGGSIIEHRGAERTVELAVIGLVEALYIYAQINEQAHRFLAVFAGILDGHGAAVGDQCAVTDAKLIALCVSSKIVMIVKNQYARTIAGKFPIKIRSGKTADACSNDNQVVALAGRFWLPRCSP